MAVDTAIVPVFQLNLAKAALTLRRRMVALYLKSFLFILQIVIVPEYIKLLTNPTKIQALSLTVFFHLEKP